MAEGVGLECLAEVVARQGERVLLHAECRGLGRALGVWPCEKDMSTLRGASSSWSAVGALLSAPTLRVQSVYKGQGW